MVHKLLMVFQLIKATRKLEEPNLCNSVWILSSKMIFNLPDLKKDKMLFFACSSTGLYTAIQQQFRNYIASLLLLATKVYSKMSIWPNPTYSISNYVIFMKCSQSSISISHPISKVPLRYIFKVVFRGCF